MKQENYIVGIYLRLSQEDERSGESLSIDNQRIILRKYAEERGWKVYDEYVDDGISGTTFDRPGVQRLLDDAKTGVINTIIVKDLSRFGRNYIEVGQYIDYVFPSFGIRFIAIQDNIDTANRDSSAMEMMPIMNIFNEWHAANTSKKIRAVKRAHAKDGMFSGSKVPFGYLKGTDTKRTFVIDEEIAPIVVRIFEMYASGISPERIAETLNKEGVPSPGRVSFLKLGRKYNNNEHPLWEHASVRVLLKNIAYIGHLAQQKFSCVSYKNHKIIRKTQEDWVIVYNTHPPIISQELWDKVQERMKSRAHGRRTKIGFTHPLSGFVYCADCGSKMKLCHTFTGKDNSILYNFNCGLHKRFGKIKCFSHFIQAKLLEELVLDDIRTKAQFVMIDEQSAREAFIRHNEEITSNEVKFAKREIRTKQKRIEELTRLIQVVYEDRVKGKMPEDVCFEFIEKYIAEQKQLATELSELKIQVTEMENAIQGADDFIRNIRKYIEITELTREVCYELIDRVIVSGLPKITGKERTIDIIYKADIASVLRHKLKK